jgi:predicted dehydrogenase
MKLRLGVVGLRFGEAWARIYAAHPDVALAALCDLEEERARALAAELGVARVARSFDELLSTDAEAVHLVTPAPLHAEQAIAALRAGKHVLCAVPAAMTLAECRRLVDAVEETGRCYMMAETSNYYPEVVHAKRLAEEGKFGRLFYCESDYLHDLAPLWRDTAGQPTWRMGLPPMLYPTHNTGPIVWVTGQRMVEVTALGWGDVDAPWRSRYENPHTLEVALFRLADGTAAKVSVCWQIGRRETVRFAFYGTEMSFESGAVPWEKHKLLTLRGETPVTPMLPYERLPAALIPHRGHSGSHPFIAHDFVRAVRDGTRPPIDVYEAVAYIAPGICAHQSALEGRPVAIPRFDPPSDQTMSVRQ